MSRPTLDPESLGLPPEVLRYTTEDGRYSVELRHHEGPIYLVLERGYADDAPGRKLIALFERLLDAVEARDPEGRIYLCADYSEYRGSSNATRKAMLQRIVTRPSLGAVAFHGAGFVTRSVAMLLNMALPRLSARPFRSQESALAFLAECAQEAHSSGERGQPPAPSVDPSLHASVLATFLIRNSEFVDHEAFAGRRRRVVRPCNWAWSDGDGLASVHAALVDDDVLLVVSRGRFTDAGMAGRLTVEDRALQDLGLPELSVVYDIRHVVEQAEGARRMHAAFLRAHAARYRHVVIASRDPERWELRTVLALGREPLTGPPVVHDLHQAFALLDHASGERLRSEAELVMPESREDLEALVRRQHEVLRHHLLARDRLYGFVGQASWDAAYLRSAVGVPDDVSVANPYWPVYGALQMMQQDMHESLRERDRQNRELVLAREQAEAANRAKTEFLGTVSHELRTPLNAIFGLTALLRAGSLDPDQRHHVVGLETAAGRLTRLVDDLLDLTRIEAGGLSFEDEPIELRAVFRELETDFAPMALAKGLQLRLHLARDLPAWVRGDQVRVMQLVANLVDNAIKFTETGSLELEVSWRAGELVIDVRDTGPGIPEGLLPRIFDRFERGRRLSTDTVPGVGLGLAICHQLAQQMGGAIQSQNRPEGGAWFSVRLPLQATAPVPSPGEEPRLHQASDLTDMLVLLVEDDTASRYVATKLLESLGCQVVAAQDGKEALTRLGRGRFDLVLMDCQLPYYDGLEVTRRYRAVEPAGQHTPIVALTAYAFDSDRDRMIDAGMDDHLSKPVTRARLQELLARYVG